MSGVYALCTHPLDPHTSLIHRVPGLGLALIPYGVRGGAAAWCQRRCCRPRSPAFSGFLLSLSTLRSALGAIAFITDGIAPADDPLLAVITPSPRWGVGLTEWCYINLHFNFKNLRRWCATVERPTAAKGSSIKDVRKKRPVFLPPSPVRKCQHLTNPSHTLADVHIQHHTLHYSLAV